MNKFSWKYISSVLAQALKQGITPRKLALTCALGVVIGIFPVFGTTTTLCFLVAIALRLNIPLIQLVNYLFAPLQIALIIPFIKSGTYLFQLSPFLYTSDELIFLFKNDFWLLVREAGVALAAGAGMWLVFSVPLFFLLFYLCFWIFSQWGKSRQRELKSQ